MSSAPFLFLVPLTPPIPLLSISLGRLPAEPQHQISTAHPSFEPSGCKSKMDLGSPFCFIRSSFNIRLSILASSPSILSAGLGVTASRTKWLSQWGQYSSASSNSCASFRKHFRHFLQANVISRVCRSSCDSCSWWHSAQSNHFLPGNGKYVGSY